MGMFLEVHQMLEEILPLYKHLSNFKYISMDNYARTLVLHHLAANLSEITTDDYLQEKCPSQGRPVSGFPVGFHLVISHTWWPQSVHPQVIGKATRNKHPAPKRKLN
jgi:hypothetical protein